jgi:predicted nucleic acid-binding protein
MRSIGVEFGRRRKLGFPSESHRVLIYLDSVIVIYFVDGLAPFQSRAQTHLANLAASGALFAVSDLTSLECLVKPYRNNDAAIIAEFRAFMARSTTVRLPIDAAVYERATRIRANLNYKLADVLHLAAAVEGKCGRFLTHDLRLNRYTDIPIEVLP